jgi:lipopolysaccharide/colanic/teichoic acid biosynthesis glycosyltransferase
LHLASLGLSSGTAGRVIAIRPESAPEHDVPVDENAVALQSGFDDDLLLPSARTSRSLWSSHGDQPFAGFNRTSEALELWERVPEVDVLPTQSRKYELGKRIFDIALAIIILPIVGVLIAIIAGLIVLTSPGPIFFRQRRIGQYGREFFIWKFRTMHPNGERLLVELLKHDAHARDEWHQSHKLRQDPRITRMGEFLRKTSLDELPQILNVLSGDMSFVGPRPIVRGETIRYAERFRYYLAAVPGITGLWQVSGRSNVSYDTRVILDETYVCKWSLSRDIWILLKTPWAVWHRDGAF